MGTLMKTIRTISIMLIFLVVINADIKCSAPKVESIFAKGTAKNYQRGGSNCLGKKHGEYCTVYCAFDFKSSSESEKVRVTCQTKDGTGTTWKPTHTCIAIKCRPPNITSIFGKVTAGNYRAPSNCRGKKHDQNCTLNCAPGFESSSKPQKVRVTCQTNPGTLWKSTHTCVVIKCSPPSIE
eukprot:294850_1